MTSASQDVFVAGSEGYNIYRIPSMIMTRDGILLAVCEGRASLKDQSGNDLVIKRSTDRGKSWSNLSVVAENGAHSLNNPTLVQDKKTGNILLMYQDYPPESAERGIQPGYTGENICRTFFRFSRDNGIHWTSPTEITKQVKRQEKVTSTAAGPGIGIQLSRGIHAGRILFPFNQGPWGEWKVYAVFSDDGGQHWEMGHLAPEGSKGVGNEVQFAERTDGTVLLNARSFYGAHLRKKAVSRDGGVTWSPLTDDPGLPEPGCQGSLIRFSFPDEDRSRIIYCGPLSQEKREYGTIHISYDEGETWPLSYTFYPGSFAYSCMARLDGEHLAILFEKDHYHAIAFTVLTLTELEQSP